MWLSLGVLLFFKGHKRGVDLGESGHGRGTGGSIGKGNYLSDVMHERKIKVLFCFKKECPYRLRYLSA